LPARLGPFDVLEIAQALARQPDRLEIDRDEARRIGDDMFGAFERGEFAADEVVVRFGEPSRIMPIARAAEEAKRAGYNWDDMHPSLWYRAAALTYPAAKRYVESCGLASAPRLLGEWFPDAISPTQTDAAAPPTPASPNRPTAAAVDKEPGARAAKPRKRRSDETRSAIIEALVVIDGSEDWKNSKYGGRCRLVEQHLVKPKGWCTLRTLGRAIAARARGLSY
jgi:hypothetical protein